MNRERLEAELAGLRESLADSCDGAQQTRLRLAIESRERELAARAKQRGGSVKQSRRYKYPRPKWGTR